MLARADIDGAGLCARPGGPQGERDQESAANGLLPGPGLQPACREKEESRNMIEGPLPALNSYNSEESPYRHVYCPQTGGLT